MRSFNPEGFDKLKLDFVNEISENIKNIYKCYPNTNSVYDFDNCS